MTIRLFVLQPDTVFAARINQATFQYPIAQCEFDGVTTGAYGDILPGQTVLFGSSAGDDDYGRQRIRKAAGATTLYFGRSSRGDHDGEVTLADDAYITVLNDFRVFAKVAYIDSSGNIYKDHDIAAGTYPDDQPPVANCGPGVAATIDGSDIITVDFDAGNSFAVATGASISTYAWDVDDGTITVGTSASQAITATFPAGFRWVSLTVTDDNGESHTARCPVFARDPDDDACIGAFEIMSHRIAPEGQQIGIRIREDISESTYPDGTLVMLWEDEPADAADRSHMIFIGWHQSDPAELHAQRTGLLRDVTLNCVDVAGRLQTLPGFPWVIEANESPTKWTEMSDPSMDKYLHYLLYWHSSALELADWTNTGIGLDYPFKILSSEGQSLWDQAARRARSMKPDFWLTCNTLGQLQTPSDPMVQNPANRTATVQATLTEADWSDIRYTHLRAPRVHWLRSHAIVADAANVTTVHCIAPGTAPGQGENSREDNEGLVQDQGDLNAYTGHLYARLNAPESPFTIDFAEGSDKDIEPADMTWVQLTMSAATAAQRGLAFTEDRGLPLELNIRYNHGRTGLTRTVEMLWERETSGIPAVTVSQPVGDVPDTEPWPDYEYEYEDPFTEPLTGGLVGGQELVAGIGIDGYIYRTSDFQTASGSGGPTWDRVDSGIADTIYSWVVDPFSPGYVDGVGSIDGWIVNDTAIYRVEDIFGTPSVAAAHTFSQATTGASYHWRTIQASFGRYFAAGSNPWLMCVSYYGDTVGHTGVWETHSLDGGVTWSTEQQITAFYDSGTPARFKPIACYLSPKTPGLAYVAAYSATGDPPTGATYVSADWGATWAAASFDPGNALAGSIHLPWPDNADESLAYYGHFEGQVATDPDLLPQWLLWDTDTTYSELGVGISGTTSTVASSSEEGTIQTIERLMPVPPADAVRIECLLEYEASISLSGGGSYATSIAADTDTGHYSRTGTVDFDSPTPETPTSGSFTITWDRIAGTEWTVNRDSLISSPPSNVGESNRFRNTCTVNAGAGQSVTATITITVTVTEIELEDETIYTPTEAGRSFRLKQMQSGVESDISPVDTGIYYGVNRYGFAIRGLDSNRQHLLMAGMGNDTSGDPDDDLHAVFISDDYGASWATVVSPIADSGAPAGRPAFEAAFSPDDEDTYYIWGPAETISYTAGGAGSLDDRSGNLSTFSPSGWIGIAGGPTGVP